MTKEEEAELVRLTKRTGVCVECGLCCLFAEPVKRVPKGKGGPGEPTYPWGETGVLRLRRQGYRVALETTGFWFMARWDPCPFYWFINTTAGKDGKGPRLGCTDYEHRPECCRIQPPNNLCLWLITRRYCGYSFPKHPKGSDRSDIDGTREKEI